MTFLTSRLPPDELSGHDLSARRQIVDFWSKAVDHTFHCSSRLSMDCVDLAKSSLAWQGVIAPGLGLAVRNMISSGKLVCCRDLEVEKGLVKRLVETPLVYLMCALGLDGSRTSLPEGKYVHRDVLQWLSARLVQHCQDLPGEERTVYVRKPPGLQRGSADPVGQETAPWSFQQLCNAAWEGDSPHHWYSRGTSASPDARVCSSPFPMLMDDDYTLLAEYMVRAKLAMRDGEVLKVIASVSEKDFELKGRSDTVAAISNTDKDLLRLRSTVSFLQSSVANLEHQMMDRKKKALKASREGQIRVALMHLRRVKHHEAARDRQLSSLDTLYQALDQVNQLRMNKQVLEAHRAATKALQTCREAEGLTRERVEDTLDRLTEEMAEHDAIGNVLAHNDADETAELELELEELVRGDHASVGIVATPVPSDGNRNSVTKSVRPEQPEEAEKKTLLYCSGTGNESLIDMKPSPAQNRLLDIAGSSSYGGQADDLDGRPVAL